MPVLLATMIADSKANRISILVNIDASLGLSITRSLMQYARTVLGLRRSRQRRLSLFVPSASARLPPKIFDPRRRQFGIAHGVLNILVTKVRLQRSGIMSLVGERVAAGVPEHVRMDFEPQPRFCTCLFDHPGQGGGPE